MDQNDVRRQASLRTLKQKTSQVDVAMLTTREPDGTLYSRPMNLRHFDEMTGSMWFITNEHTLLAAETAGHTEVGLSLVDTARQHYVSVSGRARLVHDREMLKKFWNPVLLAWFPNGLDDPALVLLEVVPTQAKYWDAEASMVKKFTGIMKAIVTGDKYDAGYEEEFKF